MKGWKTIAWNVANGVVVAMEVANTSFTIPDEWVPYWLGVYVVGNIILRLVTDGPVGKRS